MADELYVRDVTHPGGECPLHGTKGDCPCTDTGLLTARDLALDSAYARGLEASAATPREICCDTCPMSPTCEEYNDFLADIGLAPQWGEEYDDGHPGDDDDYPEYEVP